ncbi:hypothetical protein GDO86_005175, partial [Hymenochirus boettgeri]
MVHLCYLLTFAVLGHIASARVPFTIGEFLSVNGFSWSNCDGESLPGKIKSLSISPDPISIPGPLTASAVLETSVALTSPVTVR